MRIIGIDFSATFRRAWEASGGNELSEAHKRTLRTVAEIRDGYDRVALLCDGGRSFRAAMLPEYKASRERPPAPYYEQLDRTLDRLTREGCSLFDAPLIEIMGTPPDGETQPIGALYAEADDLCASLAQWCIDRGHALTLYGSDKDLLQLVSDEKRIDAWRPGATLPGNSSAIEGPWHEAEVLIKFGVLPIRIAELLALGGDVSDGFKMFPGWDDTTGKHPGIALGMAAKLLGKYGTITGVIDAIEGTDKKGLPLMKDGHVKEVLRRGKPTPRDAALLGINLAMLRRDLPVDFDVLLAEPVYAPIVSNDSESTLRAEGERQLSALRAETDMVRKSHATSATPERMSEALARVDSTATGMDRFALCPRNKDEALDLAKWLYESRLYGQYPNEYAILAVMIEAYERGVPPGLALRNAYMVKQKPAWSAQFMGALVLASGKAKRFRIIESTSERAVLEYQRADEDAPSTFTFTIAEAQTAGWLKSGANGDGKWITNPRTMLRWAAIREGARAFFFDVVAGMHTPDELRGHTSENDGTEET